MDTDKNLGPAVLETEVYIRRAFEDHLNDNSSLTRTLASYILANSLMILFDKNYITLEIVQSIIFILSSLVPVFHEPILSRYQIPFT